MRLLKKRIVVLNNGHAIRKAFENDGEMFNDKPVGKDFCHVVNFYVYVLRGGVAQWIERLTRNRSVLGSNPIKGFRFQGKNKF